MIFFSSLQGNQENERGQVLQKMLIYLFLVKLMIIFIKKTIITVTVSYHLTV